MSEATLTVTQILAIAKEAIEEGTGPVWVMGELSGFKRHQPSGHLYFDMKDGRCRISCVQWRDTARRLRFEPQDGMLVRVHGRLGVYEAQGRMQLYADALEPAGLGELQAALERLKAKLAEEGLFAAERKRPLPCYPLRIGVATSGTGAAVADILRVLGARWPVAEVVLRPCQVQGEGAAEQIAQALADLDREEGLDVILLGRGGGSIEDLWAFNEEIVVRAIAACRVPVITGIGHEIDVTLSDFAADRRAATPSQAAEIAVPSQADVARDIATQGARLAQLAGGRVRMARLALSRIEGSHGLRRSLDLIRRRGQKLDEIASRFGTACTGRIELRRRRLRELELRFRSREPAARLLRSRRRLDELSVRLSGAGARRLKNAAERLQARGSHLEAVGPRSVLARGYAICLRARDRRAVRVWNDVEEGERVEVVLGEGALGCAVEERREGWR